MNSPNRSARAGALLPLASGKSQAATAREVGVSPGVIARWLRDPAFAEELARIKALVDAKPMDGHAVLAAVVDAGRRLAPPAGGPVVVSIPAAASPARRRQLLARGIARAFDAGSG